MYESRAEASKGEKKTEGMVLEGASRKLLILQGTQTKLLIIKGTQINQVRTPNHKHYEPFQSGDLLAMELPLGSSGYILHLSDLVS